MKLLASQLLTVAESRSTLAFTTTGGGNWPVWDRHLSLDGTPLFHLGNICGTCEFLFRRTSDRAIPSFEIERIRERLESGLDTIDDTALAFAEVVPNGRYVVALFEARPRRSGTAAMPDYFAAEQRLAWRDYAEAAPRSNKTYFREASRRFGDRQLLVEFFVPLHDIGLVDFDRVRHYSRLLNAGTRPTAVSLGVLDVKESMSYPEDAAGKEIEPEYPAHWCFANYLLDGHHKVAAAHACDRPITLLTFISLDHSWQRIGELMAFYERERSPTK